jgi:exodeoxyribonuclease VII large subunit
VPVLRDLIGRIVEVESRLFRGVARTLERRRQTLAGLARALPRGDALLAFARQRFDHSAERLRGALFQNLKRHEARLVAAGTLLRPRLLAREFAGGRETAARLEARLARAFANRVEGAAHKFEACARVLDSVSYRATLARGFALVRGADGGLHRRAAGIAPHEKLTLVFADGEAKAVSEGKPLPKTRAGAGKQGQGDLF